PVEAVAGTKGATQRHAAVLMSDNQCRPMSPQEGEVIMDWKLELVVVPVSDVDRAKAFYLEKAGFELIVDHSAGDDFRVVQANPPGSACAIAIMKNTEAPGSVQGLHLVVRDIDAARDELV